MSGYILNRRWQTWLEAAYAEDDARQRRFNAWLDSFERSTGEPDKALRGAGGEQTPETGATQ